MVYSKQWRLTEALEAFRAALACYQAAGEKENVTSIHTHLADTLRVLGEQHQSWEHMGRTLEGLSQVRRPIRRYLFLYNTSLFASSHDLLEAALLFQNATVREAAKAAPGVEFEALTHRATILLRKNDHAAADQDLRLALKRLEEIPPGPLKTYAKAQVDVLMAQLEESRTGVGKLNSAIGFFKTAEPARVPQLQLGLARMYLASQSLEAAEATLAVGIARLEEQQSGLGDEALKISYFDESWNLFREMVTLQYTNRKDQAKTFEYAERSRARSLLALAGG